MHQPAALPLSEIEEWIYNWLANKAGADICRTDNYIEVGAIDSFDIINLIEDIENRFEFKFTERDFQDRRFVTIVGLAELIRVRLQQG